MELVGRVLGGRYRIERGIGAGGMGGVYEAVQTDLGRRVAVKVIAEQLAEEEVYLERFRREATAVAQIGHPNLVTVTDFQHPPGEPPFLVMELLEGEPLSDRLKRGPLPPPLAVDVTLQVLGGLGAAHGGGVVHRDLKPANVFLVPMPAGRLLVKVLDFGIAKLMDSATYMRLTQTGVLVGTPRYAAPEQITDGKSVDPRTDLYAAGALLYCMLSGRPPYTTSAGQLLHDITEKEPTDPRVFVPEVNPALVAVMQRAMHKVRELRFQTAREMSDALAPFVGDAALAPPGAPTPARPVMQPTAAMPTPSGSSRATAAAKPSSRPPPATTGATRGAKPSARPPAAQPATRAGTVRLPGTPAPADPTWRPTPSSRPPSSRPPSSRPPSSRPPRARTSSRPPRTSSRSVALGAVVGAMLGVVLIGGAGIGLFYGLRGDDAPGPLAPVVPVELHPVPDACMEWEQIACHCEHRIVVNQYCSGAQATLVAIERGEVAPACERRRDAIRAACLAAASDVPHQRIAPRTPSGYEECDELVRVACGCGDPGHDRDRVCENANQFVTGQTTGVTHESALRLNCRRELDRVRRVECDEPE